MAKVTVKLFGVYRVDTNIATTEINADKLSDLLDELNKLAIGYSDGIIQAAPDVEKSLIDFAAAKNVPVLGYNEDFADAYETFYESLFPDEAKD
jgi:molybdopterin converting factor small subunit